MSLARLVSKKSDHHTHKMGAILVKRNKVLGVGVNKIKTHPKSAHPFKMIHAELDAILDCPKEDLEGADIYVFRETKNGDKACAKPCPYCLQLIIAAGIKNVYYTDNNEYKKLEVS